MENENVQPSPEEVEEEEMERFFALVRNFKEMRDRRRKELMFGKEKEGIVAAEKKRKTVVEVVENRSTWIPKFEREDFDEEFQLRGPGLVLPMPCNVVKEDTTVAATMKKKNKVKIEDDCLDLNLAL